MWNIGPKQRKIIKILIILLVAVTIGCTIKNPFSKSQTWVSEKDISRFMDFLLDKKLTCSNILDAPLAVNDSKFLINADLEISVDLNKPFLTREDITFVLNQQSKLKNFKWDNKLIQGYTIIPTETIEKIFENGTKEGWNTFNRQFGDSFCEFSVPLFSKDKNVAIISHNYNCGPLCGEGWTVIYKKQGSKWEEVKSIFRWIS